MNETQQPNDYISGSRRGLYVVFSVCALLVHIPFSVVVVLNSFTADPNSSDPLRRYHRPIVPLSYPSSPTPHLFLLSPFNPSLRFAS